MPEDVMRQQEGPEYDFCQHEVPVGIKCADCVEEELNDEIVMLEEELAYREELLAETKEVLENYFANPLSEDNLERANILLETIKNLLPEESE